MIGATTVRGTGLGSVATSPERVDLAQVWWAPSAAGWAYLAPALACLLLLSSGSVARARRLRALRRRPAPYAAGRVLDYREIALLVDGPRRLVEVVMVAMHRRRRATIGADRRISLKANAPEDDYERMVFEAVGPARTALVDAVIVAAALSDPIRTWRHPHASLVREGLVLSDDDTRVRGVGGMCCVFLVGMGLAIACPWATSTSVPIVTALSAAALSPLVFTTHQDPQTDAGRARIAALETMSVSVFTDTDEDVLTRVAVFGVEAVPDEVVRTALMPRPAPPSTSN
ncbi:TIGR04222 domain-containing membrane protein [Streptomyces sp. SID3343]|nr:TIGR04222 domain-containing membrane protein [Streptomyces sp. SID3343]